MLLRILVYVGVYPMASPVSIIKGLLLATEQRATTSATACLSPSFMLSGLAKQPSGRTPKAESLFNRYTAERAQNSATILREGSESIGLPFSLPVGFRLAVSSSGCLQFGYVLQNRGFGICRPCKEESDSPLSAFAERSMELLKYSQRTPLRELLEVSVQRAPGILELAAAREVCQPSTGLLQNIFVIITSPYSH